MIIKINITEDILKLIPIIFLQEEGDDKIVIEIKGGVKVTVENNKD